MSERRTVEQMQGIVENEGLGYAIQSYIGHEEVPLEMAELWKQAAEAMDKITAMLGTDDE